MKYCIAIDGGGTKTDAVLFDCEGNIITRFVGPGNNPTDLGCGEALERMIKTTRFTRRRRERSTRFSAAWQVPCRTGTYIRIR